MGSELWQVDILLLSYEQMEDKGKWQKSIRWIKKCSNMEDMRMYEEVL